MSATARAGAVVTFPPKLGSRVRDALVPSVLAACVLVFGVIQPHEWLAWPLLVGQLSIAVIRWLAVRDARRQPWALRVDASGVWWQPEGPPMPWTSVATIEVQQARGWRRLLPHWNRVLLVDPAGADFARRAGTRPIGRSIMLDHVRATPEAIVAALRAFTDAPAGLRLR